MSENQTSFKGAFITDDEQTYPEIWLSIHRNANVWANIPEGKTRLHDRTFVDGRGDKFYKALKNIKSEKWRCICEGVGWTGYGATALSWCKGAQLADVLDAWRAWKHLDYDDAPTIRAARLMNPDLLPEAKLSVIIEAGKDMPGTWVLITALKGEIEADLPDEQMAKLNARIRSMIKG